MKLTKSYIQKVIKEELEEAYMSQSTRPDLSTRESLAKEVLKVLKFPDGSTLVGKLQALVRDNLNYKEFIKLTEPLSKLEGYITQEFNTIAPVHNTKTSSTLPRGEYPVGGKDER